jgi:membrane AbrB-like protein
MTAFQQAWRIALTLAVGLAGALLLRVLNFPAPWLTGSMVAVSILALARRPLFLPSAIRQGVFLLLGVSMGSGVTPETAAGVLHWPASLVILAVTVTVMTAASAAFLIRAARWSRATAFFASVPGALSYVMAVSLRSSADTRLVIMAQMLRVVALLLVLPVLIATALPHTPRIAAAATSGYWGVLSEILLGGLFGYALEKLSFPGGMLFGGMLGSSVLHLFGEISGPMPPVILIPCQVILGCLIGLRFLNTDLKFLAKALGPSSISFLIALSISAAGAVTVAWALNVPIGQVIVAFAPGGLEAMTILAFVLGLDPAFVATHQLARFLGIALLLPFVAKVYLKE